MPKPFFVGSGSLQTYRTPLGWIFTPIDALTWKRGATFSFTLFNKIAIFSCIYDTSLASQFSQFSLFPALVLKIGVSWSKKAWFLTNFQTTENERFTFSCCFSVLWKLNFRLLKVELLGCKSGTFERQNRNFWEQDWNVYDADMRFLVNERIRFAWIFVTAPNFNGEVCAPSVKLFVLKSWFFNLNPNRSLERY